MITKLTLVLFFAIGLASFAEPTRDEIIATVGHMQAIVHEQQRQLADLTRENADAVAERIAAQQATEVTQKEIDTKNARIAKLEAFEKAYHRVVWPLAALAGVCGAFVILKTPLTQVYPPISQFVAPACGFAITFALTLGLIDRYAFHV